MISIEELSYSSSVSSLLFAVRWMEKCKWIFDFCCIEAKTRASYCKLQLCHHRMTALLQLMMNRFPTVWSWTLNQSCWTEYLYIGRLCVDWLVREYIVCSPSWADFTWVMFHRQASRDSDDYRIPTEGRLNVWGGLGGGGLLSLLSLWAPASSR